MELGVLKGRVSVFCGVLFLAAAIPSLTVSAEEAVYPMVYGEEPEGEVPVMELREPVEEYTVQPGESLWSIADKLWGDGREYKALFLDNKDSIADPGLIYPGMVLQMERTGYIVREEAVHGGFKTGEYSMDTPYGWTVGTLSSGDAFANFALSGSGIKSIVCLIQDKKKETVAATADWEKCVQKIQDHARENYAESVSGLSFSHYRMGEEEVYLYSFNYKVDMEDYGMSGGTSIRVCAGMKLTGHIQAEFVGFASDYDIDGCVRYVTASFEEHSDSYDLEEFTVNDSNMAIVPEADWEVDGMINSFAWVDEFWTSLVQKAVGAEPEETDKRKAMIDRMSSPARQGVSYGD